MEAAKLWIWHGHQYDRIVDWNYDAGIGLFLWARYLYAQFDPLYSEGFFHGDPFEGADQ